MSYTMQTLALSTLAVLIILSFSRGAYSSYAAPSADEPVKIIAQSSFVDSEGRTNIVGTVRNTGTLPIEATVGLAVQDKAGIRIEEQHPYGRIIWPLSDSPFKFVCKSESAGAPFIGDAKGFEETKTTNMIILN